MSKLSNPINDLWRAIYCQKINGFYETLEMRHKLWCRNIYLPTTYTIITYPYSRSFLIAMSCSSFSRFIFSHDLSLVFSILAFCLQSLCFRWRQIRRSMISLCWWQNLWEMLVIRVSRKLLILFLPSAKSSESLVLFPVIFLRSVHELNQVSVHKFYNDI